MTSQAGDTLRCLSVLVNERCQGLTLLQHIALAIPIGIEIPLVPVLLVLIIYRPASRSTAPFLILDILFQSASTLWDLMDTLIPVTASITEPVDTSLAIVSSLPTLAFLLFATALFLSDIQPCLPATLRSRPAMQGFAIIVAPLVPIGFVGALVGSFLLVSYTFRRGRIDIEFITLYDETVHNIISIAAAIAVTTYLLLLIIALQVTLLDSQSRARWKLDHAQKPRRTLSTLATGFFLCATETILVLVPTSFAILLSRQILTLLSRCSLVCGTWKAYQPPCPNIGIENGFTRVTFNGLARLMSSEGEKPKAKRELKEKHRPTPLKLKIGGPVDGTFRHLSTEATRDFYDTLPVKKEASPVRRAERVVFRTPLRQAPALSFTSSIFSDQPLSEIATAIQPTIEKPAAPSAFKTKKNYGSIYRPLRISVEPAELAQWPPNPAAPQPVVDRKRITNFSRPSYSQPVVPPRRTSDIFRYMAEQATKPMIPVDSPPRPPRSVFRPHPFAAMPDTGDITDDTNDTFGMVVRPTPQRMPTITVAPTITRSNSIPRKPVPDGRRGHEPQRSLEAEVFPVSVSSAPSMDLEQFPVPPSGVARKTSGRRRVRPSTSVMSPSTIYSNDSSSIKTLNTQECKERTSFFFATPVANSPVETPAGSYTSPSTSTSDTFTPRPRMTARKSSEIMSESPFAGMDLPTVTAEPQTSSTPDLLRQRALKAARGSGAPDNRAVSSPKVAAPDFSQLRRSLMELQNLRRSSVSRYPSEYSSELEPPIPSPESRRKLRAMNVI